MTTQTTRRDVIRGGLAVAGLTALGMPEWVLPALAQGETVVPFTDWPANFNPTPGPDRRLLDTRTIDGAFTPADQFFTTQHYGHPDGRSGDLPPEGQRAWSIGRWRCRSTTCRRWAAPSSSPASNAPATGGRCRGSSATAAGPACRSRPCSTRRRQGQRARVRLLRRRQGQGRSRVPHAEVHRSSSSSAGACTRDKALSPRTVPRLRAQRRAADDAPGRAAPADRPGLVRRRQRQVALADPRAGRRSTSASSRRGGTARSRAR